MIPAGTARDPEGARIPAGLVSRLLAAAVDAFILAASFAVIHLGLKALGVVMVGTWPALVALAGWMRAAAAAGLAPTYHVAFWAIAGRTPGKWLLGLRVVTADGRRPGVVRSTIRFLAYSVSIAPLLAGVIAIAFDPRRRAWHDRIARTQVVYDSRPLVHRLRVRLAPAGEAASERPGVVPPAHDRTWGLPEAEGAR